MIKAAYQSAPIRFEVSTGVTSCIQNLTDVRRHKRGNPCAGDSFLRIPTLETFKTNVCNVRCCPIPTCSALCLCSIRHPTDVTQDDVQGMRPFKKSTWELMMKADSEHQPGITKKEFQEVWARCGRCGLYITKRAFEFHVCEMEVIDLTDSE
jgi:hypothetical protein